MIVSALIDTIRPCVFHHSPEFASTSAKAIATPFCVQAAHAANGPESDKANWPQTAYAQLYQYEPSSLPCLAWAFSSAAEEEQDAKQNTYTKVGPNHCSQNE